MFDEAADQLYSSSLEDFASERARLVKELRAAGKPEDAGTLAKSRKPTVGAWVLNHLESPITGRIGPRRPSRFHQTAT